MADILSTLRELRSLEEKRAHGTLSPEEEARFQELQATVTSRGQKPKPAAVPADAPAGTPGQGVASDAEAPFVDADLTEEAPADPPEASSSEPTVVQAPPAAAEVTAVVAAGPIDSQRPVPMSPAELRQWNASFTPPRADVPVEPEPTPATVSEEEPTTVAMPSVPGWLEALPPPEVVPESNPAPTAADDDAPMAWTDPLAGVDLLPGPGSAEATPDLLPSEPALDNEPTRLVSAAASMDPTLADTFEPPPSFASGDAEVTSQRMTPIGEAFAAGESRVVVHTLGGVQKRGSIVDAHMNADFLELRLPDGEREMLSTASLKAVFFVVPIGQDVPTPVGDPVTVTLLDGHQLVGLSPDYQVGAVGFFLSPTDQRSRTAKIYIYAGAVKGIS